MTGFEFAAAVASATLGGALGAAVAPLLDRLLPGHEPDTETDSVVEYEPPEAEPPLPVDVWPVAESWAASIRRPEATPWAHGYLRDTADALQRHRRRQP